MASYRYYRVQMAVRPTMQWVSVAALKIFDTVGGTDLTIGATGTPIESGHTYIHDAASAFDHDDTTVWQSNFVVDNPYVYLGYDFGHEVTAAQIKVSTSTTRGPSAGFAEGSHDGITWVPLSGMLPMDESTGAVNTIDLNAYEPGAQLTDAFAVVPEFEINGMPITSANPIVVGRPYGGPCSVAGTVDVAGSPNTPIGRPVHLHERVSGRVLDVTRSDPVTGGYRFNNLAPDLQVYVVALDIDGNNYNGVIKDGVTPEVLP